MPSSRTCSTSCGHFERSQRIHLMKHLLKQITIAAIFAGTCGALAHASTIDFSGSVTGMASFDSGGRCAPSPTLNATGAGVSTALGDFVDIQNACMTSDSSFDDGAFDFKSVSNPENSFFGTYFAVASSQDGMLELTSIFLVTGGTGLFANDFGAIFGLGTLDQSTGSWNETFSGQLDTTVPEPGTSCLMAGALAAIWLLNRRRIARIICSAKPSSNRDACGL